MMTNASTTGFRFWPDTTVFLYVVWTGAGWEPIESDLFRYNHSGAN